MVVQIQPGGAAPAPLCKYLNCSNWTTSSFIFVEFPTHRGLHREYSTDACCFGSVKSYTPTAMTGFGVTHKGRPRW